MKAADNDHLGRVGRRPSDQRENVERRATSPALTLAL